MKKLIPAFIALFLLFGFGYHHSSNNRFKNSNTTRETSACRSTSKGLAINWHAHEKLAYADFKADKKNSRGFAIATASSNFGYEIEDNTGEFAIDIYVHFYCKESWWNPRMKMDDVLSHEQLHFDICELYGRKFYKAVLGLKEAGEFNEYAVARLYDKMEKEFDDYQDLYDDETDHSTNGDMQSEWDEYIHSELERLKDYAGYWKF
jgi:hypothetical protein